MEDAPLVGETLHVGFKRSRVLFNLLDAAVHAAQLIGEPGKVLVEIFKLRFLILYQHSQFGEHGGERCVRGIRMVDGAAERTRLAVVQGKSVALPVVACHERVGVAQGVELVVEAVYGSFCVAESLFLLLALLLERT